MQVIHKHFFKIILTIMLCFTAILSFLPAVSQASSTDDSLQKIKDKGTLVVGLSADYAPYEFHKNIDGKDTIVGFEVSIAQQIAKDLDVKIEVRDMGFDALLGALKNGKIDLVISGMSVTPEREDEVDFSNAYFTTDQYLVVKKDNLNKYSKISSKNFSGARIGAQTGTTQFDIAKSALKGAKPVGIQKVTDMMSQFNKGKIDGVILESPIAEAYVANDGTNEISPIRFKNQKKDTAIAIKKDSPALQSAVNQSIKDMKSTGKIDSFLKKANEQMIGSKGFSQYIPYFINGTGVTILLAIVGVFSGTIFGFLMALMKMGKTKVLRWLAIAYISFIRGTPMYLQILIVYLAIPKIPALAAGMIAIAINSTAYVAEIFRAGIQSVDPGQTEAARSLGLTSKQTMRTIILPQATKTVLPALGNEFITILKDSSIVSVIGIGELMYQAGVISAASFKPLLPYLIISVIYFVLTLVLSKLLNWFEGGLLKHD